MLKKKKITVIDLFAGPGGLGEGFQKRDIFGPIVSVEKDKTACNTLKIRKIFHLINNNPSFSHLNYLDLINTKEGLNKVLEDPQNNELKKEVENSVWNHEIGTKGVKYTCNKIKQKLKNLGWSQKTSENNLILIGGPPCQAYSLAGRSRRSKMLRKGEYQPEQDERNFLYENYLEIVSEFKPSIVIMENVPGILSSKVNGNLIFNKILDDLSSPKGKMKSGESLKYELFSLTKDSKDPVGDRNSFEVNSNLFGIPQSRKRIIILGIRNDLVPEKIPTLKPSESITAGEALMDLPFLRSGITKRNNKKVVDTTERWTKEVTSWKGGLFSTLDPKMKKSLEKKFKLIKRNKFPYGKGGTILPKKIKSKKQDSHPTLSQWILDDKLDVYLNSESRSHMDSDLRRYIFNSTFAEIYGKPPLIKDYPKKLLPKHKSSGKGHHDRFRTVLSSKPSSTITSHLSKDGHAFIHPDPCQCRSLTVREAARLQSFPDNYFFSGNRSQQFNQVGNAVPPFLAYQISKIVSLILSKHRN